MSLLQDRHWNLDKKNWARTAKGLLPDVVVGQPRIITRVLSHLYSFFVRVRMRVRVRV